VVYELQTEGLRNCI